MYVRQISDDVTVHFVQNSSSVLTADRRSFSDERKTCQRVPLSAATSLTSSTSCTRRPPGVDALDYILRPACRRDDDDGGRATPAASSARYKTELCRAFSEHGACRYGDRCQFAHGRHDLRAVARHPKYKTDLCRTYHSTGLCPYGPRCHFIHDELDAGRRPPPPPPPSAADERGVDVARELQLRLALLSLYQRQTAASQSNVRLNPNSEQTAAAAATPAAAARWHVPVDRRQSVRPLSTVVRSVARLWPAVVASSPAASVGDDSASSSAVDDDSPPPRSPAEDAGRRHLLDVQAAASNDRLTALLVLAARRRLLHSTVADQ